MSSDRFDSQTYCKNYDGYAEDIWSLDLTLMELYMGHFLLLSTELRLQIEPSKKRWFASKLFSHPFICKDFTTKEL
ncbi:hypothetical protein F8388_012979 [Cannabis sativa]|uniref:Uncharacterized protein n=1 Tax=Cannabis sativa TaxID=3483 RepID=A0A7J6EA91_CANSA|nr:hypothetical protein F8388_012979 [Cannabis sativa]